MKPSSLILLIALTAITTLTAFRNDNPPVITMKTAKEGKVEIKLKGAGTATVHWGDGATETQLLDTLTIFKRSGSGERVIAIGGDSITGFVCDSNSLTALDISKCVQLEWLTCNYNELTMLDVSNNTQLQRLDCPDNQLTTLDVSRNTLLKGLYCTKNQLNADALNNIFRNLSPTGNEGTIIFSNNPGTGNCNRGLAPKGWRLVAY